MTLLEFLQEYDVHQLLDCFVSDGVRRLRVHPDAIAATDRLLAADSQARPETFPLYGYAHAGSLMLTTFRMSFEVIGAPAPKSTELGAALPLATNGNEGDVLVSGSEGQRSEGVAIEPFELTPESQLPVVASQASQLSLL